MRKSLRPVLAFLAWYTVPAWLGPVGWWSAYHHWAVLGHIGSLLLGIQVMLIVGVPVAIVVILGAPVAALWRTRRRRATLALCQAVVFLLSLAAGAGFGRLVWLDRVERFVARSEPLVAAIHEFTADRGRSPESLEELTPRYLAAVPTTGIGAWPDYRYVVGKPEVYDGNPWVLLVTPPAAAGFDSLMYFPLQNYPRSGYGGGIERVGTWGYVHE